MMLAHDHLYPDPDLLVTFLGLHDVARFMNEPGATVDGLKLAFTFLMTARGIPHDLLRRRDRACPAATIPTTGATSPAAGRATRATRSRRAAAPPEEQAVFDHLRRLRTCVRSEPALRRGTLVQLLAGDTAYVFARVYEGRAVFVAFNGGDTPLPLDVVVPPGLPSPGTLRNALPGGADARIEAGADGAQLRGSVPAHSTAVFVEAR